jgi:hypothetical protein
MPHATQAQPGDLPLHECLKAIKNHDLGSQCRSMLTTPRHGCVDPTHASRAGKRGSSAGRASTAVKFLQRRLEGEH